MNNWIRCEDKMPPTIEFDTASEEVLVTAVAYGTPVVRTAWTFDGEWQGLLTNMKVVAWMPLPKPFREEEEYNEVD